jgi:OmpA-OmpF porin, OOP family
MKTFLLAFALMLTVGIGVQAQTATDSWAVGFGLSYPRFYSANITTLNSNYGAYLSAQRNFSEHVGLRLSAGYAHLEGKWYDASLNKVTEKTELIRGDLDLLYYLAPCAPVSPYLFAGVGANYKTIKNGQSVYSDDNKFGSQLNIGAGAEFKLSSRWSLVTEFGYHVTNNSELEGTIVPAEINGHDSYLVLSVGMNYFFNKGPASKQCETCPCEGIASVAKDMTDYKRIEDMIVNHMPKEVVKEVVVDRYIAEVSNDRLVLVGVNFAFDKSDLLPESYPVLDKAVKLLNDRPNVNVEIQGYTDYVGTESYNQELSVERAQTVKAYLVTKGIVETRLTTVGYGKGNPVANNDTEEGRTMNRRIVFKIVK